MSLKLLQQSLDIIEQNQSKNTKKNTSKDKKNKQENAKQTTRGKVKRPNHRGNDWNRLKGERSKNIHEIKEEINQSKKKSDTNLKKLLALSKNTLNKEEAEKIVNRAHKGRYVDIKFKAKEIESVFTDEDFRAFEEEYFK